MKKAVINLDNMEFYAFHGCYEEERVVGNRFRVDLSLTIDAGIAAASDSVADTVNYLDVYQCVREEMMKKSRILEHVVARILDAVTERFPGVLSVRVRVAKMAPPLGGQVESVSIEMEA